MVKKKRKERKKVSLRSSMHLPTAIFMCLCASYVVAISFTVILFNRPLSLYRLAARIQRQQPTINFHLSAWPLIFCVCIYEFPNIPARIKKQPWTASNPSVMTSCLPHPMPAGFCLFFFLFVSSFAYFSFILFIMTKSPRLRERVFAEISRFMAEK